MFVKDQSKVNQICQLLVQSAKALITPKMLDEVKLKRLFEDLPFHWFNEELEKLFRLM